MCVCVYSGYVCMLWTDVICLYSFSSSNKLLGATVSLVLTALWAAMMNEMGPAAQGAPSARAVTGGRQKQSLRHVATGRWESGHEAMSSVGPLAFTREMLSDRRKLSSPVGTSLVAQRVRRLPAMWETPVRSLSQKDLPEKEMAAYSSTLAWKIPRTEEPGRLQSMELQRVGHD